MKKKLNTESITNELQGASLFFTRPEVIQTKSDIQTPVTPLPYNNPVKENLTNLNTKIPTPLPDTQPVQPVTTADSQIKVNKKPVKDNQKEIITSHLNLDSDTLKPSSHDTVVSRTPGEILDMVQKAAHELGKEAATHRFTVAEKRHVAEIIFTYQAQGIKTTENEIIRIALNYLIQDYKVNGENSLLDRILKALNR